MTDIRELFDMVETKNEPDVDSWKQQEDRQRRTVRNRKVGAMVVAAAVAVSFVAFAVLSSADRDEGTAPVTQPSVAVPPAALELDVQDVAIVDLDGVPVSGIEGLPEDAWALDLSPDRSTIAFVTGAGLPRPQIATIGVDGAGMQVLRTDVAAQMPAWSADGGRIAFEGYSDGVSDIYVMDADGSNVRQITDDPAPDIFPRWSPDGSTIAYTNAGTQSGADPQFSVTADIWTVPSSGGEPTRLTTTPGPDSFPDYSPDGTQIAFHHDGDLWVMRSDGRRQERVLGSEVFTPRWSPDGTMLAYTLFDGSYRPTVDLGGLPTHDLPLVMVNVVDLRTGEHHAVGDVGMATDLNTPIWWSNDSLLIRRVGH
jgi:Tol biopolymer transport system component